MKTIFALLSFCLFIFGAAAQAPKDSTTVKTDTAKIKIETIKLIGIPSTGCPTAAVQDITPSTKPFTVYDENTGVLHGLDFRKLPTGRNVNDIANTKAGVLSMDGGRPSFMGARPQNTAYYFDGVRIMDNFPR